MSDIFVSYASEDRNRVRPIVDALEARGWTVWWDSSVKPGQIWDEVIGSEIEKARCVLVLWSQHAIESAWVRSEAYVARQREILVPALLDNVRVPIGFTVIQAANLVDWKENPVNAEFEKLASAIEIALSRTPSSGRPTELTARDRASSILAKAVHIRTRRMATAFGALCLAIAVAAAWYIFAVRPFTNSAAMIGLKSIEQGKYSTGENDRLGNTIRNAKSIKLLVLNASTFSQTFKADLENFFSRPDVSMQVILATADSQFYREMTPMTFNKKLEQNEEASETNSRLIAFSKERLMAVAKDENKIEFRYFDTQFRLPLIIIDDKYCYLTIRLPPNEAEQSPRLEFEGGYAESCTSHFNRLWQLSSANATRAGQ